MSIQSDEITAASEEHSQPRQPFADFSQHPAAIALARLKANPRVSRIRLIVSHDACPACRHLEGDYDKDEVPELPLLDCSHPLGCRCFYEPKLEEVYP